MRKKRIQEAPQMIKKSQWTTTFTSKSRRWTNAWWGTLSSSKMGLTINTWRLRGSSSRRGKKRSRRSPSMKLMLHLGNGYAGLKNQAQTQVMSPTRDSPPAPTCVHHPTLALRPHICKAMEVMMTPMLLQLMNFLTLFMSTKKSLRNNQKKLKTLMILMLLLIQIMKICYANSNCLARSMKSSN